MVDNDPIILKVINTYKKAGVKKFIICLGFGAKAIKEFFIKRFDIKTDQLNIEGDLEIIDQTSKDKYLLIDTGAESGTGDRLKRVFDKISSDHFFLTYADGVTDLDISKLYEFFLKSKSKTSILAINPDIQYGVLSILQNGLVENFIEKPKAPYWINAGYFVIDKNFIKPYLFSKNHNSSLSFEVDIVPKLIPTGLVSAYKYQGFWRSVDNAVDLDILKKLLKKTS
jgi:glucose-1-phosphate cytidylyltransferase